MRYLVAIALLLIANPAIAESLTLGERVDEVNELSAQYTGSILKDTVKVECDIELCDQPRMRSALIDLVGLDIEQPLSDVDIARAWSRLMRTGYFRQVIVHIEKVPASNQITLRFSCTGHVIIQDLRVEYSDWSSWLYPKQFVAEIRKRLPLRRGGSFPSVRPDGSFTPEDQSLLEGYESRVLDLYRRQGYLQTRVKIIPKYFGDNQKKVVVTVRITEGEQPELGGVLIKGAQGIPYSRILNLISTGERTDFWRRFFGLFGIGRYARRQLKDELVEVESMYRQEGWVSARVRLQPELAKRGDKVFPKVRIIEGKHLVIRFEGNETLTDGELRQVLTFSESGTFDDAEIEESVGQIRGLYQAAARYFVTVTATKKQLGDKRYMVSFNIKEGPQVYARSISIAGNRRMADKHILDEMETKGIAPEGVVNALTKSAGIVQDERLINDLNRIRSLYRKHGMPGIKFRCANAERSPAEWTTYRQLREQSETDVGPTLDPILFRGQFDVWSDNPLTHRCFQVIPDEDPRFVRIQVDIDEGLRTEVDSFDINAIIARMDSQMQAEARALLEEQGIIDEFGRAERKIGFTQSRVKALRGFILRYLHQNGYLSARVTPACELHSGRILKGKACSEDALYGISLKRVFFELHYGPQTLVSGILLRGNLSTEDSVITDELLLKNGQPLGSDGLFLSQANLRSLGVFSAINIEYIGQRGAESIATDEGMVADQDATIVVTVEESKSKLLEAYVGLQIDSTPLEEELPVLYAVGTTARHRNFLGRALEVGVGVSHSNRIDAASDVENDDAVWRAGPFFKNRRLFGTRLDLAIETLFERGRTSQRDAYQEELNAKATVGFDFYNLSYPSRWGQGMRATVKTEFVQERLRPLTRAGERPLFDDPTKQVTISPTFSLDRRDSPLHPTQGWLLSTQAEFVFPELLAIDELPVKATFTGQYVQSFFKRQLMIVPNLRLGAVWTDLKEDDLQSDFFFKAGGDGVALPIRGYEDASVEACNGSESRGRGGYCTDVFPPGIDATDTFAIANRVGGRAMMLGGIETRFPTFALEDFWFAAFFDFGAIAPTWREMTSDRFKTSVGGGLRWLLSGQIPLRLDLAYPLTPTYFSEQTLRVHLNIFYTL